MRRRWLITGAGGMLGRDLAMTLEGRGQPVIALDRGALDVTDRRAVARAIGVAQPAVVLNCAAWTGVDAAEAHEDQALAVNGMGAGNVAAECERRGAVLVYVSSDYVFGGTGQPCFGEQDRPAPLNAYGRTKLAGERATLNVAGRAYVLRTAWLYGAHGPNFVRTMIDRALHGTHVEVVDDQRGQPTWTRDVANRIVAVVEREAPTGIYHATSSGATTWFELARSVYGLVGASPDLVTPITSDDRLAPARRPASSVLGHGGWARIGMSPLPAWQDALAAAIPVMLGAQRPTVSGAGPRLA